MINLIFYGHERSGGPDVRRKAFPQMFSIATKTKLSKNRYEAWADLICFQYF